MNNPCPQCPWRKVNHGKRHFGSFYSKANLNRLSNQVRRGGRPQGRHLTDPSHPDHIKAGRSPDAQTRECPGSVILILREIASIASSGPKPGRIDEQAVSAYLKKRRRGLNKTGILYWLVSRYRFGGAPIIGGPKSPEVDADDPEIDLPDYLFERFEGTGFADYTIYVASADEQDGRPLAGTQGAGPEDEANAHLIVVAWNAAREINKENPIAAARAMPEIFRLLSEAVADAFKVSHKRRDPRDWIERANAAVLKATARE